MKQTTTIIIFSAFLILTTIYSCTKYSFKEYTYTDNNGSMTGQIDKTDWNFNDEWTKQEENLFDTNYDLGCKIYNNYNIIAYPNPNSGYFNLEFNADSLTNIEIVLVNKSFKKLKTEKLKSIHSIRFNISEYKSGMYRVYYKFIRGNCEFRGHGDILKN